MRTARVGMSFDLFVQACISLRRMTEVFKRYDDDRDGYITVSFEEFLTGKSAAWELRRGVLMTSRDPGTTGLGSYSLYTLCCTIGRIILSITDVIVTVGNPPANRSLSVSEFPRCANLIGKSAFRTADFRFAPFTKRICSSGNFLLLHLTSSALLFSHEFPYAYPMLPLLLEPP